MLFRRTKEAIKEKLSEIKGVLLAGVSYMLPFVIAGGILVILGSAIGGHDIPDSVEEYGDFASTILWLGKKAFALMMPVLGAYVAYSITDKPGIVVSMIGGALTDMQGSGFLGALIAGIIAGYLVNLLKRINLPMALKSLLPTLIIPIIRVGAIGLIMVCIIGTSLSALTAVLTDILNSLGTGNLVLLGIIQGYMLAFDIGGPRNKVAYAFALVAADVGSYISMIVSFIDSMAPLLVIAIAALVAESKLAKKERAAVPGLFAGAFSMITESAIPFTAASPLTVIPFLVADSAVGYALSYVFRLTTHTSYGDLSTLFILNDALLFIIALLIAGTVSATLLILLREPAVEAEEWERTQDYGKTIRYRGEFPL